MKNKFIIIASLFVVCLAQADQDSEFLKYAYGPAIPKVSITEKVFNYIGDILLVRPVGTALTIANTGVYAASSPFASMADANNDVFDVLVKKPADYTFDREIGNYSTNR